MPTRSPSHPLSVALINVWLLSLVGKLPTIHGFLLPRPPRSHHDHYARTRISSSSSLPESDPSLAASSGSINPLSGPTTVVNSTVMVGEETEEMISLLAVDTTAMNEQPTAIGDDASVVATIPSHDYSPTSIPKNDNLLELWKKRLITSEDAFSLHKLAALTYTVTSMGMMGTALTRWLTGRQELFATVPPEVEPVMYVWILSNVIMCLASVRMACLHRRNDLASRNAFIGTAGSSLFSAYFLWWASPFAPEALVTPMASQVGFGILVLWNVIFVTDTMVRANDILEGRKDKTKAANNNQSLENTNNENASYWVEYLRYIATGAWGLPVVAMTGYICSVSHDHDWMMHVFQDNLDQYGHGLQASVFYNNVLASMAAAYGSLFVTLRDKRLINKRMEWIGIVAISLPALLWTIDVTARVIPYWW